MKIADVLAKHSISMKAKRSAPTKFQQKNFSTPGFTFWTCTFGLGPKSRQGFREMQVKFSQGPAIKEDQACCVMSCCALTDFIEPGTTFEAWCDDFGMDSNSRANEDVFKACCASSDKLREFAGESVLAELRTCEPE